jgi:hypothetical protein
MLGGAVHYQKDEYGTGDGIFVDDGFGNDATPNDQEVEFFLLTLDAQAEFGGANLFGSFVWRDSDINNSDNPEQYGFLFQGGFFLNESWELFGRYEWADLDIQGINDVSLLTVGFNKYFSKQSLKWTTDFGYGFDSLDTSAGERVGWQQDAPDEDGQFVFRTQLQLYF